MKRNAIISIELSSEAQLKILLQALIPETRQSSTSRSKVSISGEGKLMMIRIEAADTSALRATVNSYLRWVGIAKRTHEVMLTLQEEKVCKNT